MSKDPAFLFYPGDYLRDTQILSEAVQVSYDRIMCEHMRNICITQKQLNFLTKKLSKDEKEDLLMVLTKVNGGYQIAWVAESIVKRRAYSISRSENRTGKKKNTSTSYDNHMENEDVNENVIVYEYDNKNETINILKLWISTFGKNPSIPEQDETIKLLTKYGKDKTYKIMYQANLDGFKKIKTLVNALDENGNIKAKDKNNGRIPKGAITDNIIEEYRKYTPAKT